MPAELFEYKSTSLGNSLSSKGAINLDEAQGIVECFVAGIGNKDSVGDIVASGAFTKSLQRRKPRVVWGHSWNDPIGKVLEIYEVPNTDNRLPLKMKMAGIGGLFARVQFNLNSEKGREAFAMVAFFGEEQEWSIGYKTLRAQFDQKSQANVIYELELYEVSPVLHGANQLTGTISVKSDEVSAGMTMVEMPDDEQDSIDKVEIEKQLAAILGAKVSLMDVNDDEITFARRMDNGEVGRYKCGFSGSRGRYMFGAPEPIVVMPMRKPIAPMPNMVPMAGPGMPANEPQRVIRPTQMPSMPVAIKPGENGNRMVPLPPVQYEDGGKDREAPEFDPTNLDQEEADLRDALLKIVKRHGRFNEDSEGVYAAYKSPEENPVASIGVKCANCVFYQGGNSCKIIALDVEPEGKCRFAVIPKGVVKGDTATTKSYQLDEEFEEEDYIADLEVKYPGELAVAALRGVIGRRRKKRRKFKLLGEFGKKEDDFDDKPYLLPVVPQFAFQVKQALDPIFDYHHVDSFVDVNGIVITSGVSFELIEAIDNAVENLKKKSLDDNDLEWKAAGYRLGRAIGSRLIDRPNIGGGRSRGRFFTSIGAEDFDPFTARDANLNGIVGEGLFLRGVPLATPDPTPDGPGSIRNPKPSRRQLSKPESEFIQPIFREDGMKPKKPEFDKGPFREDGKPAKDKIRLASGAIELDLPRVDDPDVDSATKYGAAESQRDELQGVLDEATDADQIKKLKKAIADLDKYMKRVERMAEGEIAESDKQKKKPEKSKLSSGKTVTLKDGRKLKIGPKAALQGEDLSDADLRNVDLSGADLQYASLNDANLSGANLRGAFLEGADLSNANLSNADLSGADLEKANLSGANLTGANLDRAGLEGANLTGAKNPKLSKYQEERTGFSSEYAKYLDKPEGKRTAAEKVKYDGALSSGKLKAGDIVEEGSPEVQDMYDEMTKQILEALLALSLNPDSKTWQFPWRNPEGFARNPTRGRIYQGSNQMVLSLVGKARGYETARWAGPSQWKALGGKISAQDMATKGVKILVPIEGRDAVDLEGNVTSYQKTYKVMEVFNVADVKGLPARFYEVGDLEQNKEQRIQDLETVIKEIGPAFVESKGSQAFYRPSTDKIHMPAFEQFKDALAFYGTAMHETIHWTSHPSRMNRKLGGMFGDEDYAFEELIAEIGSAFAMGSMGLEPVIREDHILYLASWMKKLQSDPGAIHRAILQAQQANDYLLNRSATMRRLAGIPDDERKGKIDTWLEVPSLSGYEDSPLIPPSRPISGFIEDMLDLDETDESAAAQMLRATIPSPDGELSRDEKIIRASEYEGDIGKKGRDGKVIGADGLSSGKVDGPIKGSKDGVPEIKRGDRSISYRRVFKLKVEPTSEQKDILDLTIHMIRNKDPRILSVLAGAGTGKTTSLKNIAWVLAREFTPRGEDDFRDEHLRYLADRYDVSFDGLSIDEQNKVIKDLADKYAINDMYYAVFGLKNQLEAELEFPGNTGVATTSKIWYWSLTLGQGDERFGPGMKRKLEASMRSREGERRGNKKKNGDPAEYTAVTFDGQEIVVPGRKPGFEELGWKRLDDGKNWAEYLKLEDRPDKITFTRTTVNPKTKQTTTQQLEGFELPNGAQVTVQEFGDLFNKAMRRWTLSVDEKASREMFMLSELEREGLSSTKGQKKVQRGEISPVDASFEAEQVPDEWVQMLQGAVDEMLDEKSNLLPHRDAGPKMWMMTKPDLRTDPGLIGHAGTTFLKNKSIPQSYKVGDTYEVNGEEWIVASVSKGPGKSQLAKLAKKFATKERPLAAFFIDEGQDSNPIIEQVVLNNRDNLPIIIVGDDRQGVFAFNDAKNILASVEPDYELEITQSFRYGENVGHLGNLVLALQNLYLEKQGVKQPPWKHVKGEAQAVVYKNFDDLLPEKDRVLKGLPELSDAERRNKILYIEKQYGTPEKPLDIVNLSRKEQDKVLLALRNELVAPKAGRIVDTAEEIKNGNLPTMILTRSNRQIINEAQEFLSQFLLSPLAKDADGNVIFPEIVIPAKKHAEMVDFAEHLYYALLPESGKRDYEKQRGGKPKESKIIGPAWTAAEIKRKVNQSQYSQLTTLFRLTQQPDPNDPEQRPLGAIGLRQLLVGTVRKVKDNKGQEKIKIIPPVMIAERETLELASFDVSPQQIQKIATHKTVKVNVRDGDSGQDNQLEQIMIIPAANSKKDHGVYGQLEIEGGSADRPGKATGRIFITGDGADTGRPSVGPDGKEKPLPNRKTNGRYRRDLEKIIERLGLQDKVKPGNELARQRAGASRRSYDGFIIDAGSLEENSKILADIGRELRESAKSVGGDVEITTAQLAKGRESRFVKLAEDFYNPAEVLAAKPKGQSSAAYMEETNLVYVALTRATEMIDPGESVFQYYLADTVTADQRRAISAAAKRGDLPEELDKGAFADGTIELPDKYKRLNTMQPDRSGEDSGGGANKPEDGSKPVEEIDVVEGSEEFDADEIAIEEIDGDEVDPVEDEADSILDREDEERILGESEEFDDYDDEAGQSLSSGKTAGGRSLSSGATDGLSRRVSRRTRQSRLYPGSLSAQQLAGIRISGNPESSKNREALQFAMQAWDGVRRRGIAIDADVDDLSVAERQEKTRGAMARVGRAMQMRQNRVRVGRVSDNSRNENPSAETWMLSVDKLADTIRIPTEFSSREDSEGNARIGWTQSRPASRQEIARMLGLGASDAAKLKEPDAGINHDAVRLLIAELGRQEELAAWRYFAPVSADEARQIIPSPQGDTEEMIPQLDLALENAGRANMRDRFIIETFGKDAFPHWFDTEENQSITPEEYAQLGEVSEVSKFRATGRFAPDSATKGDSEAEVDLYGESLDMVMPAEGSVAPSGETVRADKTSREDFEIEPLLDYLGIDRKEWRKGLQERLSAAFGTDDTGINSDWSKVGIPPATVAHMIRTGVLPDAASVWKDGDTGERFDDEIKKSKYVVYEALNEFIDKSFPDSRLNNRDNRNRITGATDMGVTLSAAAAARGSVWTPKKGNEPRFSNSEMQSMVDRFNQVFGTEYTIDDIFSDEQLRTARERIAAGETLSGKKRTSGKK